MTIANELWERNHKVLDILKKVGHVSLRTIARLAGLSKDAVRRAVTSLERRHVYPESSLWETTIGRIWLFRLLIAVILEFGMKDGVGAESISSFFYRIHLEKELAVSPNALLVLTRRLENLVIEYGQSQEGGQAGKVRDIIAAGDETFFKDRILLVAMDLGSGYLLMEEDASDRTFETWSKKLKQRLEQIGCHVRHFVSDRAKALVKLAWEGLGCHSGADLFHAQQEISRWLGVGFRIKLGEVKQEITHWRAKIRTQGTTASDLVEPWLAIANEKQRRLEEGKEKYEALLRGISIILHPFTLIGIRKNTPAVVVELTDQARTLSALGEEYGISNQREKLEKFIRQIGDLSTGIDAWWLWVEESIRNFDSSLNLGMEQYDWAMDSLLPKVYWERQADRAGFVTLIGSPRKMPWRRGKRIP